MRAAVIHPEDEQISLVEMPDDPYERLKWYHEQVGELLDWTGLTFWGASEYRVHMVANDFMVDLEYNALGTQMYSPFTQNWPIAGPIVITASNLEGEEIDLPQSLLDKWAGAGFTIVGPVRS